MWAAGVAMAAVAAPGALHAVQLRGLQLAASPRFGAVSLAGCAGISPDDASADAPGGEYSAADTGWDCLLRTAVRPMPELVCCRGVTLQERELFEGGHC